MTSLSNRTRRRPVRVAVVATFAGLLVSCGSDDADVAESSTEATTTTSVPPPEGVQVAAGLNDPQNPTLAVLEFMPDEITVDVGAPVEWVWQGPDAHSVTFLPLGQDPPPPASDPSLFTPTPPELAVDGVTLVSSGLVNEEAQPGPFLTTFPTAGDYPYFCAIHIGMTGVVHVGAPSAQSDTPAAVLERRLEAQARLLERGRAAMADFLSPDGERIDNGDGTTTWVVEMGETTENADLLVFGPGAVQAQVGDTVRFVNNSFAPHTASFFGTGAEPLTDPNDPRAMEPTRPPPERLTAVGFVNTGWLPADEGAPLAARTFDVRLEEAGTFAYLCILHATAGMAASIEVT